MFLTKFTTYLFLFMQACSARPVAEPCTLTCDTTCVTCTSLDTNGLVTLDLSTCKDGNTLSWLACGSCASLNSCDGTVDGLKCNELTTVRYYVDPNDESGILRVQIHDGRMAGNVDCTQELCYGGSGNSCGAVSGVCNFEIPLSSCPPADDFTGDEQSIVCTSDSDCLSLPCGEGKCITGFCEIVPSSSGTVCRVAGDLCDEPEVCNGVSPFCPMEDVKKPIGTICRAAVDLCDVEDTCDGVTDSCVDVKAASGTVCRPSVGACDVQDTCDGFSDTCQDVKVPGGTVCRPAVYGLDGTSCDIPESCSGIDNDCPSDEFRSAGYVCRSPQDACDVSDMCSGTSATCPEDLRNDYATSMKCANTCYTCGAVQSDFTQNKGGVSMLGGCTIGKCTQFVALAWPECVNTCANRICDNYRGLSNIAHYTCDKNNGKWVCADKTDISSSTSFPICPPWYSS